MFENDSDYLGGVHPITADTEDGAERACGLENGRIGTWDTAIWGSIGVDDDTEKN